MTHHRHLTPIAGHQTVHGAAALDTGYLDDDDLWHPPTTWRDDLESAVRYAENLAHDTADSAALLIPADDVAFSLHRLTTMLEDLLDRLPNNVG